MLNVMIVDDEPPARARLGQVLLDCSNQVQLQLVGEAGGGIRGLEEVDRLNPDVVLLDVHMPDMNGIEVARHLAQRGAAGTHTRRCRACPAQGYGMPVGWTSPVELVEHRRRVNRPAIPTN